MSERQENLEKFVKHMHYRLGMLWCETVMNFWNDVSMYEEEGALERVLVFLKDNNCTFDLYEEWRELTLQCDEEEVAVMSGESIPQTYP